MMRLDRRTLPVVWTTLWLAGAAALAGQGSVLTLTELDDDGKTTNLDGKPLAIVDINSEIKVRLNPTVLQTKVAQLLGEDAVSDELIDRATVLQDTSRKGLELIEPLTRALEKWAASPKEPDDVRALSEGLDKSADAKLGIIEIAEKDPALYARLNATYERVLRQRVSRAVLNRAFFETAAEYAGQLRHTIDESLQREGAYVQFGAWIVQDGQSRPLHLHGFDAYPESDFFVVDRWTLLPLNEQQKQQLKDLESAAQEINEDGMTALLKTGGLAQGAVADFLKRALDCLDKTETTLASLKEAVAEDAESILKLVDEARRDQRRYMSYVVSLRDKYASEPTAAFSSGAALLESTHADLVELQLRTKSFVSGQARFLRDLQAQVKASALNLSGALAEAEKALKECMDELEDGAAYFAGHVSELLKGGLFSQQINTAVLEFGQEVLRHTLDKVPQSTELNLKRTGMRKAGDVVVLKLAVGSAQRQRQILEDRRLDLHRVLPHIQMAIGMIFAEPAGSTLVQNRFQAAPAYSILLKGFGERGITYNRLLTPGFGVNVSALDFNKDDTLELGIAAVGSVFRDYFQLGYGYNINEDVAYWFFGLRLPLATFTLPRPESGPRP